MAGHLALDQGIEGSSPSSPANSPVPIRLRDLSGSTREPPLANGQMVRHLTLNQETEGSSPSSPANPPAGSEPGGVVRKPSLARESRASEKAPHRAWSGPGLGSIQHKTVGPGDQGVTTSRFSRASSGMDNTSASEAEDCRFESGGARHYTMRCSACGGRAHVNRRVRPSGAPEPRRG